MTFDRIDGSGPHHCSTDFVPIVHKTLLFVPVSMDNSHDAVAMRFCGPGFQHPGRLYRNVHVDPTTEAVLDYRRCF